MTSINWFEIPALDIDRAATFYEKVLAIKLKRENFGGVPNAMFPYERPGTGGAVVADPRRKPTADGAIVYLAADGKLDACVARVEKAGGKVVAPKIDIGPPGFIALFQDTEGNVVGIHSPR